MGIATGTLLERRNAIFGAGTPIFYEEPLELVRGKGVHLYDPDGRQYLDMYNNVPCVGHCNDHVVEAIGAQAADLNIHSRYLHEGVVAYAERLVAKHAPSLDTIVFACTGTEANEVAITMARLATGGTGIICSGSAYHGNSTLLSKLTYAGGRSDPEIRSVRFPEKYRVPEEGLTESELADLYLADVEDAIKSFAAQGVPLAAMLICSTFANEGLPDIPAGYMKRACELVREAGGLVIADEVQAGLGRSGRWWGYEVNDFLPDIVTMGKPLGNGVPLAAAVASAQLVEKFRSGTYYFNTFAASPLQAAAGNAVLDVIESEDLVRSADEVGNYIRKNLANIDCDFIGDIRGSGLFIGIDWVLDKKSKAPDVKGSSKVVNAMKDKGFLISNAGAHFNVLKVRPPLVFQKEHADAFLSAFAQTVQEV